LHELRHQKQLTLEPESHADVFGYYQELDADWAAQEALRSAGLGDETRRADRNARYMHMLTATPKYWFAAALDALEAGETPKDW